MKPSEGSRALIKSIRGTKAGSRANYEETFALSIVTCEDRCEEAGEVLPGDSARAPGSLSSLWS